MNVSVLIGATKLLTIVELTVKGDPQNKNHASYHNYLSGYGAQLHKG